MGARYLMVIVTREILTNVTLSERTGLVVRIHVLNLPIRILKFLHCNCALCEGQKGQNSLSPSHLIKICRLNLNISCDPGVCLGNITTIASCWDNIHYTRWCHAVSSHITGMGITRDTVWCVICDSQSIVTRSHKQICYIHWSRTIDLGLPHLGPACSPFVVNIILLSMMGWVWWSLACPSII